MDGQEAVPIPVWNVYGVYRKGSELEVEVKNVLGVRTRIRIAKYLWSGSGSFSSGVRERQSYELSGSRGVVLYKKVSGRHLAMIDNCQVG